MGIIRTTRGTYGTSYASTTLDLAENFNVSGEAQLSVLRWSRRAAAATFSDAGFCRTSAAES